MIRGSDDLDKRGGLLNKLLGTVLFADEIYLASTVTDFVNGREEVVLPPTWAFSSVRRGGRSVSIVLADVEYLRDQDGDYFIEDTYNDFQIHRPNSLNFFNPTSDVFMNPLSFGTKLHKEEHCRAEHLLLRYFPKRDKGYVYFMKRHSTPMSDNSKNVDSLPQPIYKVGNGPGGI